MSVFLCVEAIRWPDSIANPRLRDSRIGLALNPAGGRPWRALYLGTGIGSTLNPTTRRPEGEPISTRRTRFYAASDHRKAGRYADPNIRARSLHRIQPPESRKTLHPTTRTGSLR